ncbi:hypothetical protein [Aquimarina sp. 2201CG14-23]|uniref:hypothetical protein n=1 Tax=Aquimarina mycalae TaxID=3040073 RepID=UPI0024780BDA|nr:hypothetical protein [Aquimarina sp. 2201CG14-23]MDH7447571.1 hypothetical protein [Aquimarina sp. 2201CG14-23]
MKVFKSTVIIAIMVFIVSCGKSTDEQSADAKGFSAIENEIKSKFGNEAYFTDITITYNSAIGNIIGVTVTDAPESLKMGQWNLTQNAWRQNTEISLEVPQGSKAADFMFQLNEKMNLSKLGELVEISGKQLKDEKNIENPTLNMAYIKFPKNGNIAITEYVVALKPESGGATYTFRYKLNGDFIKMDY